MFKNFLRFKNYHLKINCGFTLIEIIVVVAVIGLSLPVLIGTVFVMVRQQTKIVRLSQIKREGDNLIGAIENTVKDRAISIHSDWSPTDLNMVCKNLVPHSSTSTLTFSDKNGRWFGYELNGGTVASRSASISDPLIPLTSSKSKVSAFSIGCSRVTDFSPPVVTLSFDICYETCDMARPEDFAKLHYQTRIKLRNY